MDDARGFRPDLTYALGLAVLDLVEGRLPRAEQLAILDDIEAPRDGMLHGAVREDRARRDRPAPHTLLIVYLHGRESSGVGMPAEELSDIGQLMDQPYTL
jgi:hypothetical protein